VIATTCAAAMRTGCWMTLGLFILAAPWHIALAMDDPQAYLVVPIWFAALGTIPLVAGYFAAAWAGRGLVGLARKP
jgi:hypothetical protein